jgi:hypothetical protein
MTSREIKEIKIIRAALKGYKGYEEFMPAVEKMMRDLKSINKNKK